MTVTSNLGGSQDYQMGFLQFYTNYKFRVFNNGGNGYASGSNYSNEVEFTTGGGLYEDGRDPQQPYYPVQQ